MAEIYMLIFLWCSNANARNGLIFEACTKSMVYCVRSIDAKSNDDYLRCFDKEIGVLDE